jgi:D-alanine-D-alanine ligase
MKVNSVAVLRGGPSAEYDISMLTGAGVLGALKELNIRTKDIVVTRSGQWLVDGFHKDPENALLGIDVVFLALHGAYGEDGVVQRLLERLSIPYTGSGPYASAVAMNKELTKGYLKDSGIKTAQHKRVLRDHVKDPMQTALSISEIFGPKYVVKPTSGGSSIGTKLAQDPHELGAVLAELFLEHEDLLVEEYIFGKEATVGVLENFREQPLYDLPVIEIIPPADSGFFAADVKYTGATTEICPGRFKKEEKLEMAKAAQAVHKTLGLRHYSRSDFIVAADGIYFLEVNTLPGLTEQSLYPKAMEAVGADYKSLIEHLVTQAAGIAV